MNQHVVVLRGVGWARDVVVGRAALVVVLGDVINACLKVAGLNIAVFNDIANSLN